MSESVAASSGSFLEGIQALPFNLYVISSLHFGRVLHIPAEAETMLKCHGCQHVHICRVQPTAIK